MKLLTIDFETYYDQAFSLRKQTTEEYIRDPMFETIGVAIKEDDAPAYFVFGEDAASKALNELDIQNSAVLCHNAAFDGAILNWHYKLKPKLWLDTLSMARPFHPDGASLAKLTEYYGLEAKRTEILTSMIGKSFKRGQFTFEDQIQMAAYAAHDAELTCQIFRKLRSKISKQELASIDQTIRMYTEPQLELDQDRLKQYIINIELRRQKLLLNYDIGMIHSAEEFAKELRKYGVEPPTKVSPKTGKTVYAFAKTDQDFLALQKHPNAEVQTLVAARLGLKSTLEQTRAAAFFGISTRGPLPVMLNYYGAHTGRYSGGDKINLQNLPRGGELRKSIVAPSGHCVVAGDLSQIEARLLAYVAGQDDLVEAFAQGRDVYSEFATAVYGRPITKADKTERFVGKTCILGLGYGVGADKLQKTLAIGSGGVSARVEKWEAQNMVDVYRTRNHRIKQLWYRCNDVLASMAAGMEGDIVSTVPLSYTGCKIILPNGLPVTYTQLSRVSGEFQYLRKKRPDRIYGAKMVENIIQALAAIIIRQHMLAIRKRYPVVLQVHDEIVCVVPEAEQEEAKKFIEQCMTVAPLWAPGLPIACEVGSGPNYGEAK